VCAFSQLSIIFGVAHMFLGICCSLVNHLEYRKPASILFEFVPEVVFFLCIFGCGLRPAACGLRPAARHARLCGCARRPQLRAPRSPSRLTPVRRATPHRSLPLPYPFDPKMACSYLVFMIFLKWATPWEGGQGPMLLNVLIDMFMSPGTLNEKPLFPGQATVQLYLLGLAFISVPFLLLPKPLIGYYEHRRAQRSASASHYTMMAGESAPPAPQNPPPLSPASQPMGAAGGAPAEDEEEYSFTDEFVHQVRAPETMRGRAVARMARCEHHARCMCMGVA